MSGTQQIRVAGTQPTQLVSAGDPPTLLYNQDPNNTVMVGDSQGMNVTQSGTCVPLAPLGSLVVDGKGDKWAAPQNPDDPAIVSVIPGGLRFMQIGGT